MKAPHWRRHAWRVLALWALLLAAYSNSFRAGLVFDGAGVVSRDARIRAATGENVALIFSQEYWPREMHAGLYRPLTTLSYLFNYAVLGDESRPAGYHWINFVLHGVNVTLVYALGILLLGDFTAALALAAVWGLHPLLTEAVTNVAGRADLLAAFGVLAGLLCHVKAAGVEGRSKLPWLAGLAAAATIGIFSKESAIVLPALMLLYDLTWLRRPVRQAIRLPAYAALLLPLAAYFLLRAGAHPYFLMRPDDNPLFTAGFWTARLTAVKAIGKFLWLFCWPAHLSADYSYNAVPLATWPDAEALAALAISIAAAYFAVRWYRTHKPLFFFLAFFFVAIAPVSNLAVLIGSIMAERFVYLPSIGLAGCLVVALRTRAARFAWPVTAAICIAFAARTYSRNFDWYDERALWTSAAVACPESFKAHNNLANALLRTPGDLPEAIAEYEAALRIKPDLAELHNNLASALAQMPGRLPQAISEYQAALRIDPRYADAHNNLANALSQFPDRLDEAVQEYRAALAIDPDDAAAHNNLGSALARIPGRLPEAIAEHQAALRIDPRSVEAHFNLANALAQAGRLAEAIAEYGATLQLRPDSAEAHCNLGVALAKAGRVADAIAEYRAALRIVPDFATAHFGLGYALMNVPERLADAVAEFQAGLRSRPDPAIQQLLDRLIRERHPGLWDNR